MLQGLVLDNIDYHANHSDLKALIASLKFVSENLFGKNLTFLDF
jgi:hypothetical protein